MVRRIPEGDDRERLICPDCNFVPYENPKIVVGSVVAEEEHVLRCRRAIEPRAGFWTIPAGFMELGETVIEAPRNFVRQGRVALVAKGVAGFMALSIGALDIYSFEFVTSRFNNLWNCTEGPRFAAGFR